MTTLWGKYHTTGITLLRHTLDVVEAGDALFGPAAGPTRLGECWLRFFRLPAEGWPRFHANLLAAELLHDWGKANDGMQKVLNGTGGQAIRHEHFSALLIGLPAVTTWLNTNPAIDVPLVLSTVLTHHLKASAKADGFASPPPGAVVRLLDRDGEFRELTRLTGSRLGMSTALDTTLLPAVWPVDAIRTHRKRIQDAVLEPLRRDKGDRIRMLTAVRAALIAADAAGSGYARTGRPVGRTVWRQFAQREPLTGDDIRRNVIDKRIADLNHQFAERGKPSFVWNQFQTACDHLPDRALLLAPCGSGKTLAAWRWIAARADKAPVGRVLFLYPTRATAKEGFRDYVSWAPEADAKLMHANAAFDLNGMFDNGDARGDGSKYEADRRLFSLGYWPGRVFSATVDQFLGFLQHAYGPMCMLPVLADSVIVVDEVHSFDRNMFTALKEFLKNFRVPVLCMTATLPRDRIDALKECGLELPGEKHEDLELIAGMPRYTLTRLGSRDEAFGPVRAALAADKRVLWVANTVRRCHEITAKFAPDPDHLRTADGAPVFCYHSRFRLADRVARHDNIVTAMKAGRTAAALGVTTQVCEMSLDLDVDLLVTEDCPVTSLIQRMGRCNRDRKARDPAACGRVLVYQPDSEAPYSPEDLKGLAEFLGETDGRTLNQAGLEAALRGLSELPPWLGDNVIMFLASGPYAVGPKADDEDANTFREGTDYNRPCVLPGEVGDYLDGDERTRPGFIVPVPKKWVTVRDDANDPRYSQLPRYVGVAVAGHYHPTVGFCDRPVREWGAE